jgi:hypothetical protein
MLMVDEDLFTKPDHLMGVDLNRNNAPYWATSTRSSPEPSSIVHHGASPHSEPETQALAAAADLRCAFFYPHAPVATQFE